MDLEEMSRHHIKVYGDIFESLIGAVYLDSDSDLEVTEKCLFGLIQPYIEVYKDEKAKDFHPAAQVMWLWQSKSYTKMLTLSHIHDQNGIFVGTV